MKKMLVVLLAVLMVLPLSVIPAGAKAVGGSLKAFEGQDILTDLTGAKIGDTPFSVDNYPYRAGATAGDMQLLTLFEYGYCDCKSTDSRYEDYALFLYVYNPGNVPVSKNDLRHAATLAICSDSKYEKYNLRLLSFAGDGTHDRLLLKFKVEISATALRELIGTSEKRVYKLSEIEVYAGGTNATAARGGTYAYTGYMSGYGDTMLEADVTDMETLSLDLEHCVWRSDHSPKGAAYKTQLDSVYFAVPNSVFAKYGNKIARIKYHAYQYETGYIAVFRDDENGGKAYDLFKPYEGKQITNDIREIPTLCDNRDFQFDTTFCYNNRYNNVLDRWFVSHSTIWANKLSYVLKMPASTNPNSIIETDIQQRLTSDWNAYNSGEKQSFFLDNKKDHEVISEIGDKPWTIDVEGSANWLQKLFLSGAYKSQSDDIKDIQPIRIVESADFDDFEKTLYVDAHYKNDLLSAYNAAERNDESLVLFHFGSSDYFAIEVECNSYLSDGSEVHVYGEPGFVANETVYMDFDVIDITFEKDGVYTVLPCVANPIHVIADLETPEADGLSDAMKKWIVIIIAIILIVVAVILCPTLLPILVKIVILPYRLLWWLIKALGRGISGLIRNIKDRKK